MSKLYGKVTGDKGKSTRASQKCIETWVQTEQGRICVTLNASGAFVVELFPVSGYEAQGVGTMLCYGDVNIQHALAGQRLSDLQFTA
jgi:hypothetical protein